MHDKTCPFEPTRNTQRVHFHARPQQTDKAYEISADLPGIKKEDVKVSFTENGALTIEAERHEEKEEKEAAPKYYFKESFKGKTFRSFKLPANADTTHVNARLTDGVLHLSIPKKEGLPSERTVEIK